MVCCFDCAPLLHRGLHNVFSHYCLCVHTFDGELASLKSTVTLLAPVYFFLCPCRPAETFVFGDVLCKFISIFWLMLVYFRSSAFPEAQATVELESQK